MLMTNYECEGAVIKEILITGDAGRENCWDGDCRCGMKVQLFEKFGLKRVCPQWWGCSGGVAELMVASGFWRMRSTGRVL